MLSKQGGEKLPDSLEEQVINELDSEPTIDETSDETPEPIKDIPNIEELTEEQKEDLIIEKSKQDPYIQEWLSKKPHYDPEDVVEWPE